MPMYLPGGRRAEAAGRRPYCSAAPAKAAAGSVCTWDVAPSPASAAQQTSASARAHTGHHIS